MIFLAQPLLLAFSVILLLIIQLFTNSIPALFFCLFPQVVYFFLFFRSDRKVCKEIEKKWKIHKQKQKELSLKNANDSNTK